METKSAWIMFAREYDWICGIFEMLIAIHLLLVPTASAEPSRQLCSRITWTTESPQNPSSSSWSTYDHNITFCRIMDPSLSYSTR